MPQTDRATNEAAIASPLAHTFAAFVRGSEARKNS
jgi:hypothetical protein